MALVAPSYLPRRRNLVRIGQGKSRACMIESGIRPSDSVVALRTQGSREARGYVVRYGTPK